MANSTDVHSIYIGYYARCADPAGFAYWNSIASGYTVAQIADFFALSDESKAEYPYLRSPREGTADAFVTKVYQNVLGRAPDSAGLAYWSGLISNNTVTVGGFIATLIGSVLSQSGTDDKLTLQNRINISAYYVGALAGSGRPHNQDFARRLIAWVDKTLASYYSAEAFVDAYVQTGTPPNF